MLGWNVNPRNNVLLIGYFDDTGNFYKKQIVQRVHQFSKAEIQEIAEDILDINNMRNMWTCTSQDFENDWICTHKYEHMYLKERAIMFRDFEKLSINIDSILGIQKSQATKAAILVGV